MRLQSENEQAILARLESLENNNRRLAQEQTVTARRFVLVDAGGKTRAVLDVSKDGAPMLALRDAVTSAFACRAARKIDAAFWPSCGQPIRDQKMLFQQSS